MTQMYSSPSNFGRAVFQLAFAASLLALGWSVFRWNEINTNLFSSVWGIVAGLYLGALILSALAISNSRLHTALADVLQGRQAHPWLRLLAGAFALAVVFLIPWLKFTFRIGEVVSTSTVDPILSIILFCWLSWWLILLAVIGLRLAVQTSWQAAFAGVLLVMAAVYEIYLHLGAVTVYPFSMGWSETSRFYYASLPFSNSLYDQSLPLSFLHPTRYFLQSIPFLVPTLDLTFHRAWQAFLWIGLTLLAAWALGRRVGRGQWLVAALTAWVFVFWLQIGVYYHLQVMTFLVISFTDFRKPRQTLLALLAASLWAGMSRVNWFPVPAMLVIAIYLMEQPVAAYKTIAAYLKWPVAWTVSGLAAALLGQAVYVFFSGNTDVRAFASSFTSDLIWQRLWPNPSFFLGIVPALLIVAGPLTLAVGFVAWSRWRQLHFIRWLGLGAMLLVLLAGGLVVSVKIGGGGDLHNMDAFAVLLGLVGLYFLTERVAGEPASNLSWGQVPWLLVASGLVIPLIFLIPALKPAQQFNQQYDLQLAERLQSEVADAAARGPVLFISERHFVTFGLLDVPMIHEYEVVTLMEMAMSNNQPYLQQFYADLENHRFAMIVTGRQNIVLKDPAVDSFAEENNVWNTRIAPYILCNYEPAVILEPGLGTVELFVPKAERSCPGLPQMP